MPLYTRKIVWMPVAVLAIGAFAAWVVFGILTSQYKDRAEEFDLKQVTEMEAASVLYDREGRELGYVVRTQPRCQDIIGYCGVTDTLVALDADWKILGLKVRSSDDTKDHLRDVVTDRRFLKKWNGLTWDQAADLDFRKAGVEGVSGATMTSMAIAHSVKARLKASRDEIAARPPFAPGWRDWGMLGTVALAAVMAFGPAAWRHRWNLPYQIFLIGYVGIISGDLLAQSLIAGWTRSGVPWQTASGLVLLLAAALLVPWATRRPFYCHHLCPHGAAQELIGRFRPRRLALTLRPDVASALSLLPGALLLLTLVTAMLALPLDLAGIEPFDAYLFRTAGIATLAVAGVGLVASAFVPQAYCRFGCPTGALLNFVRTRGSTDRFSTRDAAALGLMLFAAVLNWQYVPVLVWMKGLP